MLWAANFELGITSWVSIYHKEHCTHVNIGSVGSEFGIHFQSQPQLQWRSCSGVWTESKFINLNLKWTAISDSRSLALCSKIKYFYVFAFEGFDNLYLDPLYIYVQTYIILQNVPFLGIHINVANSIFRSTKGC
jgi:hypothetical protein